MVRIISTRRATSCLISEDRFLGILISEPEERAEVREQRIVFAIGCFTRSNDFIKVLEGFCVIRSITRVSCPSVVEIGFAQVRSGSRPPKRS